VPPSSAEGFDRLFFVRPIAGEQFEVQPWEGSAGGHEAR
jgi:hypothetical protein